MGRSCNQRSPESMCASGNAASVGTMVRGMRCGWKEIWARCKEFGNATLGLLDFIWITRAPHGF